MADYFNCPPILCRRPLRHLSRLVLEAQRQVFIRAAILHMVAGRNKNEIGRQQFSASRR